LHFSLGLWYIRNKENKKAITQFKRAVELNKNDARFNYVYAVSPGKDNPKEAIKILETNYQKHTGNKQIISGLVYYYKQIGNIEKSNLYEKKLKSLQDFKKRTP